MENSRTLLTRVWFCSEFPDAYLLFSVSTSDFGFIKCSTYVFISGYFLTKVFHPNVADNGEICVNTLKKDWKPDLGIKHVLMVGGALECLRNLKVNTAGHTLFV